MLVIGYKACHSFRYNETEVNLNIQETSLITQAQNNKKYKLRAGVKILYAALQKLLRTRFQTVILVYCCKSITFKPDHTACVHCPLMTLQLNKAKLVLKASQLHLNILPQFTFRLATKQHFYRFPEGSISPENKTRI